MRDDLKVRYPKKGELKRQDFEDRMRQLGLWDDISDVSWSSLKSLADREGWSSPEKLPKSLADMVEVEPIKQVRLAKRKDRKGEAED